MRVVNSEDIVKNKYSLKNGQIIETEKGEFYSKQIASQVLRYKDENNLEAIKKFQEIDDKQKFSVVKKICMNRYIQLKTQEDDKFEFNSRPMKKYEIYKLCTNTENLMLCDTKHFPNSKEKEAYYDKNIAFEIYELKSELEENVVNSFPELLELYQDEIVGRKNRIEFLNKKDEEKYQEAINTYRWISQSGILQELKSNYELSKKKNIKLQEQLNKANEMLKNLSKKLQITLTKYEELQNRKVSFWERIVRESNIEIKRKSK